MKQHKSKTNKQLSFSQKLMVIEKKKARKLTFPATLIYFKKEKGWLFSEASLKRWVTDEETIRANAEIGISSTKESEIPKTEKELVRWIEEIERTSNFPLTAECIQMKAKGLWAQEEKEKNPAFKFSRGWFSNFKKRHSLTLKRAYGSSGLINREDYEGDILRIREIMKTYRLEDIFNFDETSLFFKLLPPKGYTLKVFKGVKEDKTRISLGLMVNANGTERMKPLIVGKAKKPRSFIGRENIENICEYFFNKSAWVTGNIFLEYLKSVDNLLERPILLLLDNFSGHLVDSTQLKNIEFLFLPPQTTSLLQPLDQGIIRSFKCRYRKKVVMEYILRQECGMEFQAVNIRDCLDLVALSWNEIPGVIIINCWNKTGLFENNLLQPVDDIVESELKEKEMMDTIRELLEEFADEKTEILDGLEDNSDFLGIEDDIENNENSENELEEYEFDNYMAELLHLKKSNINLIRVLEQLEGIAFFEDRVKELKTINRELTGRIFYLKGKIKKNH